MSYQKNTYASYEISIETYEPVEMDATRSQSSGQNDQINSIEVVQSIVWKSEQLDPPEALSIKTSYLFDSDAYPKGVSNNSVFEIPPEIMKQLF